MRRVGRGEHGGARGDAILGQADVHVVGREQAEAGVVMRGVVPGEEVLAVGARVLVEPNRSGNAGRYFSVLNCASEKGLSLDTWGRECVLVTPRSARRKATDFETIAEPRSA